MSVKLQIAATSAEGLSSCLYIDNAAFRRTFERSNPSSPFQPAEWRYCYYGIFWASGGISSPPHHPPEQQCLNAADGPIAAVDRPFLYPFGQYLAPSESTGLSGIQPCMTDWSQTGFCIEIVKWPRSESSDGSWAALPVTVCHWHWPGI